MNPRESSLPIFFTPDQANEALPEVRGIVERVIRTKNQTDGKTDEDVMSKTIERLENEIQKLEDLGCVLKDMTTGLVDFPAVRLGTRVWLCWKAGEESVMSWHGLHEGFAGRKPANPKEFYQDDAAIKLLTTAVPTKSQA
jgi:hypothetical protein